MVNSAIHRVIEQQAAMQPFATAIATESQTLTYRELNQRANTLARRLAERGLARGTVALVQMERGVDLACVLFAVLKAGAAYCWIDPSGASDWCEAFHIVRKGTPTGSCVTVVDIRGALAACASHPTPNLPILTRGSDIACVLPDGNGEPHVLVPHGTITSLPAPARCGPWAAEPGAFDLWVALMSGETLKVDGEPRADAAACTSAAA